MSRQGSHKITILKKYFKHLKIITLITILSENIFVNTKYTSMFLLLGLKFFLWLNDNKAFFNSNKSFLTI